MVDSTELRDVINIYEQTMIIDDNGFSNETNVLKYEQLRCKRKTVTTREYVSASDRDATDLTYKFICYKREFDTSMFVEYKGKLFNIKHIHEFGAGRFCEITAVEKY